MNRKIVFLLLCLIAGIAGAFSQQNNIFTGKVTGEENEILIGATVFFEELGIGDDTDLAGIFQVNDIPDGSHRVIVSYVGYETVTKEIGFQKGEPQQEDFLLMPDGQLLL